MPSAGRTRLVIRESLADSAVVMPNQRAVRHQREALQTAIKLRLGWSEALRREKGSVATIQPPAANWLLIACYENFFQQRVARAANLVANGPGIKRGTREVRSRVPETTNYY